MIYKSYNNVKDYNDIQGDNSLNNRYKYNLMNGCEP